MSRYDDLVEQITNNLMHGMDVAWESEREARKLGIDVDTIRACIGSDVVYSEDMEDSLDELWPQ